MERYYYNNLQLLYKENNNAVIKRIKETAEAITKERRDKSPSVNSSYSEAKGKLELLKEAIDKICSDLREREGVLVAGEELDNTKLAIEQCKITLKSYTDYVNSLEVLKNHYDNGKIAICSVGTSGSGKSVFTQLYTGLPEDILKTHENDGEDTTGAVTSLHHIDGNQRRAEVYFRTEAEIVSIVNKYIDFAESINLQIRELFSMNIATGGDIRRKINEHGFYNRLMALLAGGANESLRKGLLYYFKNSSYLDLLNKPMHPIVDGEGFINELRRYNYIQYTNENGEKPNNFLAVRNIDLYCNLGLDGVFSDFVVSDTMGASNNVGQHSSDEIMEAIRNNDAVFSIYRAKGPIADMDFYDIDLRRESQNDYYLRSKHFAIINKQRLDTYIDEHGTTIAQPITIDNAIELIENTQSTDICYVGKFKFDANDPEFTPDQESPEKFAKWIIIDMLNKIADRVSNFDEQRRRNCDKFLSESQTKFNDLEAILSKLSIINNFNISDKLKEEIGKRRDTYLEEFLNNVYDDVKSKIDSINNGNLINDSEVRTMNWYDIIVGKTQTTRNYGDRINLETAFKEIYNDISNMGVRSHYIKGDVHSIGSYIDEISRNIRVRINKSFNMTPKNTSPEFEQRKTEMLNHFWKTFHFDVLFDAPEWNEDKISQINNDVLKQLTKYIACIKSSEPKETPLDKLPKSFMILKGYVNSDSFSKLENAVEDNENNKILQQRSVINRDTLIDVLVSCYENVDIQNLNSSALKLKYDTLKTIYGNMDDLLNQSLNTSDFMDSFVALYLDRPEILTEGDSEFKNKAKQASVDRKVQESITALKELSV